MKKLFILIIIFSTLSCKNKEQEEQLDQNREAIINLFNTLEMNEKIDLIEMILSDKDTPAQVIEEYSKDSTLINIKEGDIKGNIINSPNVTSTILQEMHSLLQSDDRYVRIIALNTKLPENLFEKLALAKDYTTRMSIAENENTSITLLRHLANDSISEVRAEIAINKNTPVDILERLAIDENADVRYNVAGHPKLPINLLEQLAQDTTTVQLDFNTYSAVRGNVASNPNTPIPILISIFNTSTGTDDVSIIIRESLALNPNLPLTLIEKLSHDDIYLVRISIGKNSSTPLSILDRLANDKTEVVRVAVASNQSISQKLLEKLAQDNYSYTLKAIANNTKTPTCILEKLANDNSQDRFLLKEIKNNPNMTKPVKLPILNKKEQILQLLPLVDPKIYSELLVGFREF